LLAAPAQAADKIYPCSVSGTFIVSGTTINNNQDCTGAITIPASVELIEVYAFYGAGVTSVTFESGSKLKRIGWGSFIDTKITSIVLPSGLEKLDGAVFLGTEVKNISIPGTVNLLDSDSFRGPFESVVFESRIATTLNIGEVAFNETPSLRSVTFKGPNQLALNDSPGVYDSDITLGWSTTSDGPRVSFPLANTNPGDLTLYPKLVPNAGIALVPCSLGGFFKTANGALTAVSANCAGEITIPADVTEIRDRCCGGNGGMFADRNITKVTFEQGSLLTRIAGNAFWGTKISTISIPGTVQDMGEDVFRDSDLESITIGDHEGNFDQRDKFMFSVFRGSFNGAHKLNSITFMGEFVLDRMPVLAKVDYRHLGWSTSPEGALLTFPYSVAAGTTLYNIQTPIVITEIPCSISGSFTTRDDLLSASTEDCAGDITIPAVVTRVADFIFTSKGLTGVTFETGSKLKSIGRDAFAWNNISELVLPPDLEFIHYNAFAGLKTTSIVIPGKVESMYHNAFGSSSLEEVVFAASVNQWNDNPFGAFDNSSKLSSVTFVGDHKIRWKPQDPNFDPDTEKINRGGYKWEGWSAVKGGPIVTSWAPLTDNQVTTVLFPNWSPLTFTATFQSNGGTSVAPSTVVGGEIQMPTAPTRAGYAFLGWTEYADGGGDVITRWTGGDNLFGAKWNANTYAVNLNSKGGTQVSPTSFRTDGAILSAPAAPTRNCSTLAGWSATDGGAPVEFPYSPGVMADITLFAKWTSAPCAVTAGEAENSQVVTVPAGTTEAVIPATEALPTVKLNLAGSSGEAVVTVAPISNPAAPSSTPFKLTESTKIVDINITGVTGNVTVCLDGESTDAVFHFSGGKWVELPQRSYANGQVCGVTSNFSPFAAAAPAPIADNSAALAAAAAAAAAAEQARAEQARSAAAAEQARIVAAAKAKAAAKDLAARTITGKKTLAPNALAKKVGVKVVSSKAKVTMKVASSSKKNCAVVAGKLKTLKAGKCVVSFTVQEPKPKKGKQPKATKATKTLVIK
jgi:hypothetical protein